MVMAEEVVQRANLVSLEKQSRRLERAISVSLHDEG